MRTPCWTSCRLPASGMFTKQRTPGAPPRRPSWTELLRSGACDARGARRSARPAAIAAGRMNTSRVDAELRVPRVRHEARELRMAHMNERLVVAAFHVDVGPRVDAVVDDDVEAVALADRRHGAVDAVAEQLVDLAFGRERDVVAQPGLEIREADAVRRRKHRQHVAAVVAQHDAFGETVA